MKLFDAHCHLQDPRILPRVPQIIELASKHGVVQFAVNGVDKKDWDLVKQMSKHFALPFQTLGFILGMSWTGALTGSRH